MSDRTSGDRGRRRREEEIVLRAVARLRAGILAMVFGLTGGTGLFVATAWLVIRGGEVVGPHLSLLSVYFPGYSVTWPGAFVGFLYGLLVGALVGGSVGWIYNRVSLWRKWRPALQRREASRSKNGPRA